MTIKIFFILVGISVIIRDSAGFRFKRQLQQILGEKQDESLSTASCIFGCLQTYQRNGVEGPMVTEPPLENGCDSLDFRDLVSICKAYQQAGDCMNRCINDEIKQVIVGGLKYICVDHFPAFEKYTSCYNQQCPEIETECGTRCGPLSETEAEWWSQMGTNETEIESDSEDADGGSRRQKREKGLVILRKSPNVTEKPELTDADMVETEITEPTDPTVDITLTHDVPTTSEGPLEGANIDEIRGGFVTTCKYVNCYVNCSRPIMVKNCGEEAHELLSHTAHTLFSFLVAPFALENGLNVTKMVSEGCDNYENYSVERMKETMPEIVVGENKTIPESLPSTKGAASNAITTISWKFLIPIFIAIVFV